MSYVERTDAEIAFAIADGLETDAKSGEGEPLSSVVVCVGVTDSARSVQEHRLDPETKQLIHEHNVFTLADLIRDFRAIGKDPAPGEGAQQLRDLARFMIESCRRVSQELDVDPLEYIDDPSAGRNPA